MKYLITAIITQLLVCLVHSFRFIRFHHLPSQYLSCNPQVQVGYLLGD